jgi:hypothetical protein
MLDAKIPVPPVVHADLKQGAKVQLSRVALPASALAFLSCDPCCAGRFLYRFLLLFAAHLANRPSEFRFFQLM